MRIFLQASDQFAIMTGLEWRSANRIVTLHNQQGEILSLQFKTKLFHPWSEFTLNKKQSWEDIFYAGDNYTKYAETETGEDELLTAAATDYLLGRFIVIEIQ